MVVRPVPDDTAKPTATGNGNSNGSATIAKDEKQMGLVGGTVVGSNRWEGDNDSGKGRRVPRVLLSVPRRANGRSFLLRCGAYALARPYSA